MVLATTGCMELHLVLWRVAPQALKLQVDIEYDLMIEYTSIKQVKTITLKQSELLLFDTCFTF